MSNYTPQATHQCTEVRFASFLFGGFITAIVVNPPEKKLAKCTYVQCSGSVVLVALVPPARKHNRPLETLTEGHWVGQVLQFLFRLTGDKA